MKNSIINLIFFLIILNQAVGNSQQPVRTWDVFEITLKSSTPPNNPYVSYLERGRTAHLTAIFSGSTGECKGRTITVPGFWDGNDSWKIRFAPSLPGTWDYQTVSADRKMNGKKGQLIVNGWTEEEGD